MLPRLLSRDLIAAVAAATLAVAWPAVAQTTRPADAPPTAKPDDAKPDAKPDPKAGEGAPEMQRLAKVREALDKVDLTAEQKTQVEQIRQEAAERMRELLPSLKDASQEDRRKQLGGVISEARENLLTVLTPEQKAKFRAAVAQGREDKADAEAGKPTGRKPLADAKRQARLTPDADPPLIARARAALADVGLTDEQKPKVDAILDDAAKQARQLRQDAAGDPAAAREKGGPIVRDLKQKLAAVLTEEQKQALAEKMPRMGAAGERGKGDKADKGLGKGRRGRDRDDGPATRPASARPSTMPVADNVPGVGDAAPAFTLTRLSGSTVTNKTFAGRPLVLVFASVTSPTLRDRLPLLADWQAHNRGRASLLLVYTREAHPDDGWASERNHDEDVAFHQAYTPADRQAAAKRLLAMTAAGNRPPLDLAVDGMDDAVAGAFGAASDTAVVLSPAGRVVGRQRWCDPSGLNALVVEALKRPTTGPSDDGMEL